MFSCTHILSYYVNKLINSGSRFHLLVCFWLNKATATYVCRKVGGAELPVSLRT